MWCIFGCRVVIWLELGRWGVREREEWISPFRFSLGSMENRADPSLENGIMNFLDIYQRRQ